jgi:hypothetical protein
MTRIVTVGAAQNGPVTRSENRADSVERLLVQLREAHRRGCDQVVFTECAGWPKQSVLDCLGAEGTRGVDHDQYTPVLGTPTVRPSS